MRAGQHERHGPQALELGARHRDEQPAQVAIELRGIVQPGRLTARLAHGAHLPRCGPGWGGPSRVVFYGKDPGEALYRKTRRWVLELGRRGDRDVTRT
jgi:hypothetical protein